MLLHLIARWILSCKTRTVPHTTEKGVHQPSRIHVVELYKIIAILRVTNIAYIPEYALNHFKIAKAFSVFRMLFLLTEARVYKYS